MVSVSMSMCNLWYGINLISLNQLELRDYGRETREERPLLTVETEVNGDSKRTNNRGLPWLVRWTCRAGTIDFCPAWAALVSPVQNIIFLAVHFFIS
jgi:hypothetical protein